MNAFVAFLHRYVMPFLAGTCAAGASIVSSTVAAVALALAAAAFLYVSLPAGGRAIRRIAGTQA